MARIACPADTPIGTFTALYEDGVIKRVLFPGETPGADVLRFDGSLPFAAQIAEYFEGKRKAFDLPIFLPGTEFRRNVYKATIAIPYGCVAAYSEVALAAGYPLAMRAVGTAMRDTPLPLIIPCHRVVHKSEKKSMYRGGVDMKRYLINMERAYM
jgi:O-6-methylguanine DNA methyltransferase